MGAYPKLESRIALPDLTTIQFSEVPAKIPEPASFWRTNRTCSELHEMAGFPKIRGTVLGVPVIRIIVFGGSPYLEKLPLKNCL